MKIIKERSGFSLVELLISIAIGSIILAAVVLSYTGGLKIFRDVKSISDNIENKTPSIELISRYFDRWGVGVVSQFENQYCSNCPTRQKTIIITAGTGGGSGCSDVTFYGNLYGMGFVQDKINLTNTGTRVLSCRLDTSTNKNCYTLWRNNTPLNEPQTLPNANLIPLQLTSLSENNKDCSGLVAGTNFNVTMDDDLSPASGNIQKVAQPGDMIQRAAHTIRLYCASNPNDNNRKWLYVDLTETYGNTCNENETASPIAPVDAFTVTAIPETPLPINTTCNSTTGGTGCGAVSVSVAFRSQTTKYAGSTYDTYTVTKIFGRARQERD